MARPSKIPRLFVDLTNINEDLSDIDESDYDSENELADISEDQLENEELYDSSVEEDTEQTEIAADGTVWNEIKAVSIPIKRSQNTIFNEAIGPTEYAKQNITKGRVISAFSLILNRRIIYHIRTCTEQEAFRVLGTKWDLSEEKFNAFLAILYARGAYEAKNLKLSYLWSKTWGPSFFAKTMRAKDFLDILRFIRFDNKNDRSEGLKTDKFAMISNVWNAFIENSQNCFVPGENITIDEQLFSTKARCRFTQYLPNKPEKFGVKFWLASDLNSKFIINGFPYLGKDETRHSSIPLSEFVALNLIEPFTDAGRNVTTDDFFTSTSLASKFWEKRTTLVGTICENRNELPEVAKQETDSLPLFSSKIYKAENCTLTVYQSKPTKKLLLLSTKHKAVNIGQDEEKLPATILFYNKTKFEVDMIDKMTRKYTVKVGSRRWPLQIFFNILDLAAINAWVLYNETTGENISRKDFLFQLAEELAKAYEDSFEKKLENLNVHWKGPESSLKRKTCQIGLCHENKTASMCAGCRKYVCGKCTLKKICICKKCGEQNVT